MKYYFSFLLFLGTFLWGQTLSSSIDKQKLTLGEKGVFTVRIHPIQKQKVLSSPQNELLPFHFEELSDEIFTQHDVYERKIAFQIFEEGTFTIPELEFRVGDKLFKTISYEIEVTNPANAQDEINDIVGNRVVELQWSDYWEMYKFYLLILLIIIALIILGIGLKKYFSRPQNTPKKISHQTLKALNALERKNYIQKEEYRLFYVELLDLTRSFITSQYKIPADILLTEDLIKVMKETNVISSENEQYLEEILHFGDQVKFAKIYPSSKKNPHKHLEMMKKVVKDSIHDIESEQLRTGL